MTLKELREKQKQALDQAKAIQAKADNGVLSDEDQTAFDGLMDQFDELTATIDEAVKTDEARAEAAKGRADRLGRAQDRAKQHDGRKAQPADIKVGEDRAKQDRTLGFKSFDHQIDLVIRAATNGSMSADDRRLLDAVTGMGQGSGAGGGFAVAPQFAQTIWEGAGYDTQTLIERCSVFDVSTDSLTIPADAETSRADGSRAGGIQAYWKAEAAQYTTSNPTLREIKLEPQELVLAVPLTNKLMNNAPALVQYVTRKANGELNFKVGDAIINGNGTGQPKGILNGTAGSTSCRVSVAKESGQPADTIVTKNIEKMWSRLHPRSQANAVWLYNVDATDQLMGLTRDVGTGGVPVMTPAGGLSESPYSTIYARPMIPIEYAATLGDEGDLILADLSMYLIGRKGGVEFAESMHIRFDYREHVLRFVLEIDGQPALQSPITPYKGTNTQSPFVTIAARA